MAFQHPSSALTLSLSREQAPFLTGRLRRQTAEAAWMLVGAQATWEVLAVRDGFTGWLMNPLQMVSILKVFTRWQTL